MKFLLAGCVNTVILHESQYYSSIGLLHAILHKITSLEHPKVIDNVKASTLNRHLFTCSVFYGLDNNEL